MEKRIVISGETLVCFILCMFCFPEPAWADTNYRFERMWPVLSQEWYFYRPSDAATDGNGYIYVADSGNHRIQKFTSDGQLVSRWGKRGQGDGEFDDPRGIVADNRGFLFVTDKNNHRVQKFTSDGEFISQWGKEGSGDGDFDYPFGITSDHSGSVYVVDKNNHRIQEFTSEGVFVTAWGEEGKDRGQFSYPEAIAADNKGFLYVADWNNHRIQKFTAHGEFVTQWGTGAEETKTWDPDGIAVDKDGFVYVADSSNHQVQKFTDQGAFVDKWGSEGSGDGEFQKPYGIATDSRGYLYIADRENSRIQKFTAGGKFMMIWGPGNNSGELNWPKGIAIDKSGFIYVADTLNHRIQKFTYNGHFVTAWGSKGSAAGRFNRPHGIAIDETGHIYVADMLNRRIQKFTDTGEFVMQWGNDGEKDGNLRLPYAIAADTENHIYVTDLGNRYVQKFTAQGAFAAQWGNKGSGEGQFESPYGIAVDSDDSVYVVDAKNHSVQKFTSDGKFLINWGTEGGGDGQLHQPYGITIDHDNHIYVTDAGNGRIQKFTPEGQFIGQWSQKGSNPGQMRYPGAIAIHPDGDIYVADTDNHRIQVFRETPPPSLSKAIIVAGGGPFPDNRLWDATLSCTHFAYRTLIHRGFTKKTIHLITDADMDLDNNGKPDDADAGTTNANLRDAIIRWAKSPVPDTLVIYLSDHGGNGIFRMNETEILSVSDLDAWLDRLQRETSATVILIYDACRSGSFLPQLEPPEGKERVIITSTSAHENAYFITQGSVSFSNYFWTQIFNGYPVEKAFEEASAAMGGIPGFQMAQMKSHNTSVHDVHIGDPPDIQEEMPVILRANCDDEGRLYADVEAYDDMARVWATIIPSAVLNRILPERTVLALPGFDLIPTGEPGHYAGEPEAFNLMGADHIAVYARDRKGNTSAPRLITVNPEHIRKQKAVIAAGWAESEDMITATEANANIAYNALTYQGYSHEDIYFLSPGHFEHADGTLTSDALKSAIDDSASQAISDMLVYLVGKGEQGRFHISSTESLTPDELDKWLHDVPGLVTVVYDADHSGSFLPSLRPADGQTRILIAGASAGEHATFLSRGSVSFSAFFWREVENGENVWNAFLSAGKALSTYSPELPTAQLPQLDDNGNGIPNEPADGRLAMDHTLGMGIRLAQFVGYVKVIVTHALSGEPIENAVVKTDMGGDSGNMPEGKYTLIQLPGMATITISAPGYEVATRENVPVAEGSTTTENVALQPICHSADYNPRDYQINLSELLRIIQLYNSAIYHCATGTEDGYAPKSGDMSCKPHDADYHPQDWKISLTELLRLTQFFNAQGYHGDEGGEDGFAPGMTLHRKK